MFKKSLVHKKDVWFIFSGKRNKIEVYLTSNFQLKIKMS